MKAFIKEFSFDLLASMSLSAVINQLMGEVVHSAFVVASGVIGAIAIYFTNKLLKKYFP